MEFEPPIQKPSEVVTEQRQIKKKVEAVERWLAIGMTSWIPDVDPGPMDRVVLKSLETEFGDLVRLLSRKRQEVAQWADELVDPPREIEGVPRRNQKAYGAVKASRAHSISASPPSVGQLHSTLREIAGIQRRPFHRDRHRCIVGPEVLSKSARARPTHQVGEIDDGLAERSILLVRKVGSDEDRAWTQRLPQNLVLELARAGSRDAQRANVGEREDLAMRSKCQDTTSSVVEGKPSDKWLLQLQAGRLSRRDRSAHRRYGGPRRLGSHHCPTYRFSIRPPFG